MSVFPLTKVNKSTWKSCQTTVFVGLIMYPYVPVGKSLVRCCSAVVQLQNPPPIILNQIEAINFLDRVCLFVYTCVP